MLTTASNSVFSIDNEHRYTMYIGGNFYLKILKMKHAKMYNDHENII